MLSQLDWSSECIWEDRYTILSFFISQFQLICIYILKKLAFYFVFILAMKKLLLCILPMLCCACSNVSSPTPQNSQKWETSKVWAQTSPLVFQKTSGDVYQVLVPEMKLKIHLSLADKKSNLYPLDPQFPDPADLTGVVSGNELFLGRDHQVHYILKPKDPEISLQQQLEKDYGIWSYEEYHSPGGARFKDQAYCIFKQNSSAKKEYEAKNRVYPRFIPEQEWAFWTLRTPYDIGVELSEAGDMNEEFWGYDQTCSSKFPAQNFGYGVDLPYVVLYSWDFPDRYLLLSPQAYYKSVASRYWYPRFEFLP